MSLSESVPEPQRKPSFKPNVPLPRIRLPENFVERPDALKSVKEKLLAEDKQTLVVSAIAGLGGLGKSVLAAALVLDEEVQERFVDGILWVTLGQSPDLQTMLAEWIRVGGTGCRVLVTTREAQIDGAEYYSLSLMSEAEAINLVRRKLKRQW